MKTQEIKHGVKSSLVCKLEIPRQLESDMPSLGSRAILRHTKQKLWANAVIQKELLSPEESLSSGQVLGKTAT